MTLLHPQFLSRRRRDKRVINEGGDQVTRERPTNLSPATPPTMQQRPHVSPTELSSLEQRRNARTVWKARPETLMTWDERMRHSEQFWETIDERFAELDRYVAGKSKYDIDLIHRWSEHLRTVRVKSDHIADADLLATRYEADGTAEMAGLQRQIRARILADALAGRA